MSRIAKIHPYLVQLDLMVDRNGSNVILGKEYRIIWGPETGAPPDPSPDELAHTVVRWAMTHAEKNGGPGSRYKVRLEGLSNKNDPKTIFTRWASLRVVTNLEGELDVIDTEDDREERRSYSADLWENLRTASDMCVTQMRAVCEQTKNFSDVSASLKEVLEGYATLQGQNVAAELAAFELATGLERDKVTLAHKTERMRRLFDWWDEFSKPTADAAGDFFRDLLSRMQTEMGKTTVSQETPLGQQFDEFLDALTPEQFEAFAAIWTPDETRLLDEARKTRDDATFGGLYRKFVECMQARCTTDAQRDALQDRIVEAIGMPNARKLQAIFAEVQRRVG